MCDLSALRAAAQSSEKVEIDSKTLLELLDAAETVTVEVVKKKRGPRDPRAHTQEDEDCAKWLFEELLRSKPDASPVNIPAWANHVRIMRERDGRTHKQIASLFRWARWHSFWFRNVRCPETLRKQWERLTDDRSDQAAKRPAAAPGQKFNFAGADRSGDQAAQSAFMERHAIEAPVEDVPL
jgi:hypothetical protein